jgi:subtilisin family serine protease
MGADIINNSWGSSFYVQSLKDAIDASDAVVVCAAGNSGWNTDTFIPHYPSGFTSANIISVAASDQDDDPAYFSNYGVVSVDVAAPGMNIYSAAPGRETVWQDNFDDGNINGWTIDAPGSSWNVTDEQAFSGSYSLTDSPYASYLNNTDSWAYSPAVDLTNHTAAKLEFKLYGSTQGGADILWVQASTDETTWSFVNFQLPGDNSLYSGVSGTVSSWITIIADLEAFDGENEVYIRFNFITNGSITADGFYIDDVKVTAASSSYSGDEYAFNQGTSMATPHVAGLAALIKALHPALTATEIKAAILDNVDAKPAWSGLVATGGRINAYKALAAPQISDVQVNSISESTAVVTWTTDKPGDSVVQYDRDPDPWDSYTYTRSEAALVTSHSVTLSGLSQQTDYYFRVGSTDAYGNGPDNKDGDGNPSVEGTFRTLGRPSCNFRQSILPPTPLPSSMTSRICKVPPMKTITVSARL